MADNRNYILNGAPPQFQGSTMDSKNILEAPAGLRTGISQNSPKFPNFNAPNPSPSFQPGPDKPNQNYSNFPNAPNQNFALNQRPIFSNSSVSLSQTSMPNNVRPLTTSKISSHSPDNFVNGQASPLTSFPHRSTPQINPAVGSHSVQGNILPPPSSTQHLQSSSVLASSNFSSSQGQSKLSTETLPVSSASLLQNKNLNSPFQGSPVVQKLQENVIQSSNNPSFQSQQEVPPNYLNQSATKPPVTTVTQPSLDTSKPPSMLPSSSSQYPKTSTPTIPGSRPDMAFVNQPHSDSVKPVSVSSPMMPGFLPPKTVPPMNPSKSTPPFSGAAPQSISRPPMPSTYHNLSSNVPPGYPNYNGMNASPVPHPAQSSGSFTNSNKMQQPHQMMSATSGFMATGPVHMQPNMPPPLSSPQYRTNPNLISGPSPPSVAPLPSGPQTNNLNQMVNRPPMPGQQYGMNNFSQNMPRPPQVSPAAPAQQYVNSYPGMNKLQQSMGNLSVTQQGFNRLWGVDTLDLLQCRNILPAERVEPPPIRLQQEFMESDNCSPDILRCTLNKIPETNALLQKSRLPLGILIHPFRDLTQLAVIQCTTIVRCRACRTYINPFVYFIDNKRWKCNLCFRPNDLPDEFQYDPVSKTYGCPTRRPEVKNSTIEFIAPAEYMLRPPQPALYLFVLDISRIACESGYLETFTTTLLEELDNLPGDTRTQIGFILYDSYVHFFSIADYSQAHEMIVTDIDDVFLPTPDSLLVNLNEHKALVRDLLLELPKRYSESFDTNSALGAALQAAYKLMAPTGGRITVFQSCLPNIGPGSLTCREDPNQRAAKEVHHLGPQTDFYKRLSLDCSTQQISVDLFFVNAQYADLATLAGVSQFSGGCLYHFPLFKKQNVEIKEKFIRTLRRYLTRKIGFEAVMRIRCSRGLAIHTFHGNFFVRSTDLLCLPNVNPDAGFGMQVSIEESLSELESVCFQAALLYTSSKGERRIRVHTLCLPVTTSFRDVLTSADQQCIVGLLAKMAVDRSLKSNMSDAREALINAAIDVLSAFKLVETADGHSGLLAPSNLALVPLYILALLKSIAFRTGSSTRLDDRVFAMLQMKTLPLKDLIQSIHADLFNITVLDDKTEVEFEGRPVAQPTRLTLSSEQIDSRCCYLLDVPDITYIMLGRTVSPTFLSNIFGVTDISQISNNQVDLPELDNEDSRKLRHFINYLQADKPWPSIIQVVNDPKHWSQFLVTDRAENLLSYYEFLQHIKAHVK